MSFGGVGPNGIPMVISHYPAPSPSPSPPPKKPHGTNSGASPSSTSDATLRDPATGLQKYSCVLCKERKIKCDRREPCGACAKASMKCIFRAPEPPKRRKRRDSEGEADGKKGEKKKVKKYEEMLRRAGVDVGHQPKETEYHFHGDTRFFGMWGTPSRADGDERGPGQGGGGGPFATPANNEYLGLAPPPPRDLLNKKGDGEKTLPEARNGRLVVRGNKARYTESNLWKVVSAEAEQGALDSSEEEEEDEVTNRNSLTDEMANESSGLILGVTEINERKIKHPDTATILRLWQIFLDNVNPLTKIIHAPTLQQEVITAIGNIEAISKPLEAILCSIYTLAVTSLAPEECQKMFGESRDRLCAKYRSFARQALINAYFLRSSDINVLIAFVYFIISSAQDGDFESRWELSGVAMRIAQRMGLHKDPETLGIDPFNCELRRRLWNQLWVLDVRCAEFAGCKTSLPPDAENVKSPTNCSDSALFPGMKSLPQEQEGLTEMSFVLLRVRLGQFLRKLGDSERRGWDWVISANVPLEEKQLKIGQMEDSLKEITQYCDAEIPIQATILRMSRIVISKLKWLAHHPRRGTQAREDQFKYGIDLVEVEVTARLSINTRRFMWHAQNTLQFDSIFFILSELRKRPNQAFADRAWSVLELVYTATPIVDLKNSKIFSALRHMTLSAWEAREAELGPQTNVPNFITRLRNARTKKSRHSVVTPNIDALSRSPASASVTQMPGTEHLATLISTGSAVPSLDPNNTTPGGSSTSQQASPLYSGELEEIDWQLWDQVFSQESGWDPQHGQWMGITSNEGYYPNPGGQGGGWK